MDIRTQNPYPTEIRVLPRSHKMVRWKMAALLRKYEEVTGKPLKVTELMVATKLSTSTTYLVMQGEPIRIGLKSIDALLNFFSQHLGELTISDLIEFEVDRQS